MTRSHRAALLVPALLLAMAPGPAPAPDGTPDEDEILIVQEAFVQAVERAAPCVVKIETFGTGKVPEVPVGGEGDDPPWKRRRNPLPRREIRPGSGPTSGVVLTADGEILTSSFHFREDPTTIVVTLADGTKKTARLVGRDHSRGLALLKVDAQDLPAARFADEKAVRVGQWALALGRSFGGKLPAAQMGIVSALERISHRAVQTDAPTSPANYGGALVNIEGEVLGVIVPLSPQGERAAVNLYDSGIGFAIPFWQVDPILDRLRRGETLYPAFLGINFSPAQTLGATAITDVVPGTAAEAAGLLAEDRILEVDGRPVRTSFELQRGIGRHVAGDVVRLKIRRGEEEMEMEIPLGRRPEAPEIPEEETD